MRVIRIANWAFVAFGIAAGWAVPERQAYLIILCLALQAVASHRTLPGPG
jgi:hypothetical protein